MKNLSITFLTLAFFSSCYPNHKREEVKCVIKEVRILEKKSVHDDMNKRKYLLNTSCGNGFISYIKHKPGDTVTIDFVHYEN